MTSILACAAMCGAEIDGVSIDSTEFTFAPGPSVSGGTYEWDIGTASSTTMLAFNVLALACFVDSPVRARIKGGVFVAKTFLEDLQSGATVDRHVADQLVLCAALARGTSRYLVPRETEHLVTNLWLIEQFGAHGVVEGTQVVIDGLGVRRATHATEGVAVRQRATSA